MAAAIRAHLAKGDYDKISDGEAFAHQLTDDLHADTRDLHMQVMFGPHPKDEPPPPAEADQLAGLKQMNYGFGPIERMQGNVAHVMINGFPDSKLEAAKKGIGDLMAQAADADALILDLRTNGGGDSDTVALVASYMFDDKPVHIVDIYEREANKTTPSWTHAKLHGKRFGGKKPVYVLTGKRTFSGGEELAYDLQTTKRATVIGETTGGGAHPVKPVSLDDSFTIMMPFAESISPITHGNWEGTGVVPDVPTSADTALDEALKRAQADLKHP
jgi:C-terminal processing protease CtpA/Prc